MENPNFSGYSLGDGTQNNSMTQMNPNMGYPPYGSGTNQGPPITMNQTSNVICLPSEQLGACKVNVICPHCQNSIQTMVQNKCNPKTCLCKMFCGPCYVVMMIASRFCGYCGGGICNCYECLCCWLCCCDGYHTCPKCGNKIGHYDSLPHC